jgi:hypothetical protein
MKILFRSLPAALLMLAMIATAASAATVTVRVEGAKRTLLPPTKVTIPDAGQIPDAESGCEWNEQAGALEGAVGANWDRDGFVQTILGETYDSSDTTGWYAWTNGKYGGGVCLTTIADGDEVLFNASRFSTDDYNPDDLPLYLRDVPTRAEKGKPFTVLVEKSQPRSEQFPPYYDSGTGDRVPAEGVVVQIGAATARTGADGRATITVEETGQLNAQARTEDNGAGRSALSPVCVSCDPAAPVAGERPADTGGRAAAPCSTTGTDGFCGSIDRQPPKALITGVREGQTFAAGRGPRELTGRVGVLTALAPRAAVDALRADPSGLHAVKLRLTRSDDGRCSVWSGSKERFVKRRCGARHGWWFRIGDRADWSYLLPARLPRGRYVLDVNAIDKAFNRDDKRRRGENRVVFRVR